MENELNDLKRMKSEKTKTLNQLKADKEMYETILKDINKKIEATEKEVERLNNVYNGLTKYEYLTDHALVRYLERSGAVDVKAIRKNLLNESVALGLINGANKVMIGNFEFIVKNGKIIAHHTDTVDSQTDPYVALNDRQSEELLLKLNNDFCSYGERKEGAD